jgi:hypothetical protein
MTEVGEADVASTERVLLRTGVQDVVDEEAGVAPVGLFCSEMGVEGMVDEEADVSPIEKLLLRTGVLQDTDVVEADNPAETETADIAGRNAGELTEGVLVSAWRGRGPK